MKEVVSVRDATAAAAAAAIVVQLKEMADQGLGMVY